LLIVYVSVAAALLVGLAIIVGTTIAAQLASRTSANWAAPR
jgi:hypothetical protein